MAADREPLTIELAAPERHARRFTASEVVLPGQEGVFTVMEGHTPFLAALDVGVLVAYKADGQTEFYAVNGGFAEVNENRVLVLTQTAEEAAEIDIERAKRARDRAEQRLRGKEDVDLRRAEIALKRAISRLQASGRTDI